MMQRRNAGCPSDLKWDQWLGGELSAEPRELERHLASCEDCQRRWAELREAQERFAREAPPFAALRAGAQQRRGPWRAVVPALLAAAVLSLAIGQPWRRVDEGSGTRTKGAVARLSWVVRRGGRVFAGDQEKRLRAGDALQFSVSAREPVYVALLGLDAGGRASVYYPSAAQMRQLPAGNAQPLELAIELDAAPGEERFFAFFCRDAVPLGSLREAVEGSADMSAAFAGCTLERVTLQKELE